MLVVLVDFSLLEVGRVTIAKTTNICTQDYSMCHIYGLGQLGQRSVLLSERKQRKSLYSVSPENICYGFVLWLFKVLFPDTVVDRDYLFCCICPTNAIYIYICIENISFLKHAHLFRCLYIILRESRVS